MPIQPSRIFQVLLSALLSAGSAGPAASQQTDLLKLTPLTLKGTFLGKKKSKAAVDLSGVACMLPVGGKLSCVAVNDENTNIQFATIDGDQMTIGASLQIIGGSPNPKTLGVAPILKCGGDGGFGELDGEAVAFSAPYFFVAGSHGCSRKKNQFRLSSFHLARFAVDAAGAPTGAVETTYRVSDVLKRSADIAGAFGGNLEAAGGLNIEGMAVDGDRIWLGLRGPVDAQGIALMVDASIKDLFRDGPDPSSAEPRLIKADLEKRGIRDLALLPDKRLLILAGAVNGPEVPFTISVFDPSTAKVTWRKVLPAVEGMVDGKKELGKAEAIAVLETTEQEARVVVLFDSLADGAPHTVTIPLR
jgi:hypothetical protein